MRQIPSFLRLLLLALWESGERKRDWKGREGKGREKDSGYWIFYFLSLSIFMAVQRTDPLLTPKKNEVVTPKKNEVVPHYLRPSSGSCHDFCKYGRKHVFEEKPWKSSRKRTEKLSHSELAPVEIFVSGEPKKEKLSKHKLSVGNNKHSLNLKLSPGIKSLSLKPKISLVAKSHSPSRRNTSSGDNKKLPKFKSSSVRKSFSPDPPEVIKR
ncbi:uncharacterized protein [Primulina huaijiensis]|uniref:uncharacterized protein isoform X3 n=1 Tax=Primulina huaijiensis TaxID=1492673 RepID=UPI003CC74CFC